MVSGKIIFITGVSSGFGRALAREALAAGNKVVGTVRSTEAKREFQALSNRALGLVLDVTDFDAIDSVVGTSNNPAFSTNASATR